MLLQVSCKIGVPAPLSTAARVGGSMDAKTTYMFFCDILTHDTSSSNSSIIFPSADKDCEAGLHLLTGGPKDPETWGGMDENILGSNCFELILVCPSHSLSSRLLYKDRMTEDVRSVKSKESEHGIVSESCFWGCGAKGYMKYVDQACVECGDGGPVLPEYAAISQLHSDMSSNLRQESPFFALMSCDPCPTGRFAHLQRKGQFNEKIMAPLCASVGRAQWGLGKAEDSPIKISTFRPEAPPVVLRAGENYERNVLVSGLIHSTGGCRRVSKDYIIINR